MESSEAFLLPRTLPLVNVISEMARGQLIRKGGQERSLEHIE